MIYIKVEWIHSHPDEPILLYSELDQNRWEWRKIEVFADGQFGLASSTGSTGSTRLGEVPVPLLKEIRVDPQFNPIEINKEEFEGLWTKLRNK